MLPCARAGCSLADTTPAQRLQFAHTKSDVVAKADGSFQPRPAYDKAKRMAEVKGAAETPHTYLVAVLSVLCRAVRSRGEQEAESQRGRCRSRAAVHRLCCAAAHRAHHRAHACPVSHGHYGPAAIRHAGWPAAAAQDPFLAGTRGCAHACRLGARAADACCPQQGLPEAIEASVLKALFVQFPGFREVRLIEARPGIAFVEFENEMQAGVALAGLQSFKVDEDHTMVITYAKR